MPYTTAHYYLTFGGHQVTNAEIWMTGYRQAPTDVARTAAELLAHLPNISVADILTDCQDFIKTKTADGYLASFSSSVSVEWAKVAVIGTDGKYVGDPKIATGNRATGSGGISTPPPQLAACVSLSSGSTFGRANHGRMYLPLPVAWASDLDPVTGQVPQGTVNNLRDSVRTLIQHTSGEIFLQNLATVPCIMSTRGLGDTKPILRVGCGRVPDTQRRRRSALVDTPSYIDY